MDRNDTKTPESLRLSLYTIHEHTEDQASIKSCDQSMLTVDHDPSIYTGDFDAQSLRTLDTVIPASEKVFSSSETSKEKEIEYSEASLVNIFRPAPTLVPPLEKSWYKQFRKSKWFGWTMLFVGLGVMLILSLVVALVSIIAHTSTPGKAGQAAVILNPGSMSTSTSAVGITLLSLVTSASTESTSITSPVTSTSAWTNNDERTITITSTISQPSPSSQPLEADDRPVLPENEARSMTAPAPSATASPTYTREQRRRL